MKRCQFHRLGPRARLVAMMLRCAGTARTRDLAHRMGCTSRRRVKDVHNAMRTVVARGWAERVAPGVYRWVGP